MFCWKMFCWKGWCPEAHVTCTMEATPNQGEVSERAAGTFGRFTPSNTGIHQVPLDCNYSWHMWGGGGALACTMHKVGPRLHLVERGLQFCRHAAQLSSRLPETTSLHNTGGSTVKGEGG